MLSDDYEEYFTADEDEYDSESYYTAVDLAQKEAEDVLLLDEILTSVKTLFETESKEEVLESKEEVPDPKEAVPELKDSFLKEIKTNEGCQQKCVPIKEPSRSTVKPDTHPPDDHLAVSMPVKTPGPEKKFKIGSQYYTSNLEYVKILGRGAFGEAVLLRDKHRKSFLVDKILPQNLARDALEEVTCLERLSGNQYFLTSLGHLIGRNGKIHIFMDYFDGIPMDYLLEEAFLACKEVQILLSKLGHAVRYMHSKNIIHMDIKPENILMNGYLDIKIIDFNVSITNGPQTKGHGGTIPFMAPEVQANKENENANSAYGYEADYHSLGITAFYMGVNHLPIDFQQKLLGETKKSLLPFVAALQPHFTPDGPDDDFHDLILGLLRQDPSERLNDETFLGHTFFKKTYQPSRPVPGPEELLSVVKALKRNKKYKKGPVCTEKSRQFQQFMEQKLSACEMTALRLALVIEHLEKKHLPPQQQQKKTKWDKIKSAFRPKKEFQEENARKPPAQEKKEETSGKKQKKKKSIFPWISKVFHKKQKDPEKSKPIGDHEDEVPVEDRKSKKKNFFKGFFKKDKKNINQQYSGHPEN